MTFFPTAAALRAGAILTAAAAAGVWAGPAVQAGAATTSGSVTATATARGADLSWGAADASTSYYQLAVSDNTSGAAFTAVTHGPYVQAHLSDLVAGDNYSVSVTAQPSGTAVGSATVQPYNVAPSTLAAPTVVSVVAQTMSGGAPALAVQIAAQPAARYEAAEALTAQHQVAIFGLAAPTSTGETVVLGPLQPATTYQIGVAGRDAVGQGAITWLTATTGAAGCSSGVCVEVGSTAATQDFTDNGVLNAIPTSTSQFAALKPAVFRVSTGYGSPSGAAQAVAATGAARIENLANAWYDKTDSGFAGGAEPPWECWTCYSNFIADQVTSIEAAGPAPAYWEVMNEPGTAGTYPTHLQGDAALYLQQLQVAAQAITSVDPGARILAPTDGTFLTGGSGLDQPNLTLDALLANAATIPGLAGLDWHEISGMASPNVAATDLSSARMLASLAGLPGLSMVVSEYTTPTDAPIPGADAAWLGALTDNDAASAVRACWTNQPVGTSASTCGDTLADGLFTTSGALTAPGIVSTYYGAMTSDRRLQATSSDQGVRVLASATSTGAAHVLLGSAASCLSSLGSACSSTSTPPPSTVTVTVPMSKAPSAKLVTVNPTTGAGTSTSSSPKVSYSKGVATVRLSLAYGAAAYLTLS